MSQTNVASCVLSIIASFSSGLGVFRKLRNTQNGHKRKIRKSSKAPSEDEVRLMKSLRLGPEEIGREYQQSIQAAGDHFAVGDAIAQTSLAEILLKLNIGLVGIINTFLSRDQKDVKLDYRSLTALSERSRIDTCRTLRQLYRRIIQLRAPLPPPLTDHNIPEASRSTSTITDTSKTKRRIPAARQTKVRGPMLARVVIENSSKPSQIALVKTGERKKKTGRSTTSPSLPSTSSPALVMEPSKSDLTSLNGGESRPQQHSPPQPLAERPKTRRTRSSTAVQPSNLPSRPEIRRCTQSTSQLESMLPREYTAPPHTSTPASFARPEARRRKPTPTYYSIASGSTRLGEIPMHRWAEPYDFDAMSVLNREAARTGWPVTGNCAAPNDETTTTRKQRGIFRIFRKRTG